MNVRGEAPVFGCRQFEQAIGTVVIEKRRHIKEVARPRTVPQRENFVCREILRV
jgi:hypothetical protein